MKLQDYLDLEFMTKVEFKRLIGVSEKSVYNWCNGMVPVRLHQLKIQAVTQGRVTLKDWEKKDGQDDTDAKRVSGSGDNGVHGVQRLGADKAIKPKGSKKK